MPSLVQSIRDGMSRRKPDEPEVMESAQQFVSWANLPYHKEFLDWLYDQADRPIDILNNHQALIAGTARANTFKEIRRYLVDQHTKANRLLDRENHG